MFPIILFFLSILTFLKVTLNDEGTVCFGILTSAHGILVICISNFHERKPNITDY